MIESKIEPEPKKKSKIILILGNQDTYKTTLMLHLLHNRIEEEKLSENEMGIIFAPQSQFDAKNLFFGRYSPVDIDVLKLLNMKFLDTFNDLSQYLSDINLVQNTTGKRPRIIAIDKLEYFCDFKTVHPKDEIKRYFYILNQLASICDFLGPGERIFLTKTDKTFFVSEQDVMRKYRVFLKHLPMKIIWAGIDPATKKLKCSVIGGEDGWHIRKVIIEINDALDLIKSEENKTKKEPESTK